METIKIKTANATQVGMEIIKTEVEKSRNSKHVPFPKTTQAKAIIVVSVECPYCNHEQNRSRELAKLLNNKAETKKISTYIECEECSEHFYINEIKC